MTKLLLLLACMLSFGVQAKSYLHSCEYADRQTEQQALACNMFFEAGNDNEGVVGLYGVAFTTLNRVKSVRFPDTIQGVVYQPYQFSWHVDGKSDRITDTYYNRVYWEKCLKIANIVLSIKEDDYNFYDITDGALFYHSVKILPVWADENSVTVRLNNHIFYKNDKKK